MASFTIGVLACLVALTFALPLEPKMTVPCEELGGFCTFKEFCQKELRPLPMFGECDNLDMVCCDDALVKIQEVVIPQRCKGGEGECNANCPITVRQNAFNNECPAEEYCCVWL